MPATFKAVTALALLALTGAAAVPTLAATGHDYELNGSLADANGGPSLTADGGTLGATGYTFGPNQGLTVSSAINSSVYSIDMTFDLTNVTGYRKLIDFKDKGSDNGLYVLSGAINFYPISSADYTTPLIPIAANQLTDVRLDRDAAGTVTGFVNGTQQFQFADTSVSPIATFDQTGSVIHFFEDDNVTGQREASGGFVDRITIDYSASPVPEASTSASMALMLTLGLGGLIASARKRKTALGTK